MKRMYFSVLAALMIAPTLSLAQGANIDAEVDQELDQMYANKQAGGTVSAPRPTATVAGTASNGSQPIYILNQATPTSNANAQNQAYQVQKQPVSVIEASPMTESKAELMRKSRQDAEVRTEQKIVEKLEQSRLEDERRRADALFGNKLDQVNSTQIRAENSNVNVNTAQQQQAAVLQPVPVMVVNPTPAPAPVVVEPKEDLRGIVREELRAKKDEEALDKPSAIRYFSAIAGITDYSDVSNVRGNYSLGASFGTKFDFMIVEGTFMFSNFDVEQVDGSYNPQFPKMIDMNQYQGSVAAKYQLMSGMVRPVVGGLAAYSYRQYTWRDVYYGGTTYRGNSSDSHAVDLGVTAGVDLEFNKNFALGFEYKYMFNLASRTDNRAIYSTGFQSSGTPLEKLSYYTLALAAKVNF
jgi:opacity protein-like surface antigen